MKLDRLAQPSYRLGLVIASFLSGCGPLEEGSNGRDLDPTSRCTLDAVGNLSCAHEALTIDLRQVQYQTPVGSPPADGWPVVIMFHASFFSGENTWSASLLDPWNLCGRYTQTTLVQRLLDAGFAVLTPNAVGSTAWDTNLPPFSSLWATAPDNQYMLDIFAAIDRGDFGPLSRTRWYATGLSSGGYMTSRMAVSYRSRFRALAVASGSYADCAGPLCNVPALPADHPPTLFLHGGADGLVPVTTMLPYRDKLATMSIPTRAVVDPLFWHGWINAAPDEILRWFTSY